MNRYSLMFAVLFAASFAAPTHKSGEAPSAGAATGKLSDVQKKSEAGAKPNYGVDPDGFLDEFLGKSEAASQAAAVSASAPARHVAADRSAAPTRARGAVSFEQMGVMFAAVPHPTETHLAAEFDENLAALQQGIQDSGYLFDSAWIPWESSRPYDRIEDSFVQKQASEYQDKFPGILLFRKTDSKVDPYGQGLVVFLIAEKPTTGLAVGQVEEAIELLASHRILVPDPIRIAGPIYSGSFASLEPVLKALNRARPSAEFLIRSGTITGRETAINEVRKISQDLGKVRIDFGSAHSDYLRWTKFVTRRLSWMGIQPEQIAILSEDESGFGGAVQRGAFSTVWQVPYPRDISSLRAGYEKQGIFQGSSPSEPWKRTLDLKNDDESEGDTIPSFGGAATIANQESVLFGISEFLKSHNIHAAVISASNPADVVFLSEFFHAHNSGVRVVAIGSTRLFLRGTNSQFRGDLIVDDFPMLPRLPDWTAGGPRSSSGVTFIERVHATGNAQGTYVAAVDLLAKPQFEDGTYRWYPEYSQPYWGSQRPLQQPPLYLSSLGSDSLWPTDIEDKAPEVAGFSYPCVQPQQGGTDAFRVEMPFLLFGWKCGKVNGNAPVGVQPGPCHFWVLLLIFQCLIVLVYCVCFRYADPLRRRLCASFFPIQSWRYWAFTVTFPAILAGCSFQVLAAPMNIPASVSPTIDLCWWIATTLSVLAPAAISLCAFRKARTLSDQAASPGERIATFVPAPLCLCFAVLKLWNFAGLKDTSDVGAVLNAYREMHWESALSLIPTWLLILFALFLWSRQASLATALFNLPPILPTFSEDKRISHCTDECIEHIGLPMPNGKASRWLWISWSCGAAGMVVIVTFLPSFQAVTTLESHLATRILLYTATLIASLMLFDICQFAWLWNELRKLLRALDSRDFKRSFVPITNFKWPGFWSFGGISFYDQRVILSTLIDCADQLRAVPYHARIDDEIVELDQMRLAYRNPDPKKPIAIHDFQKDMYHFYTVVASVGTQAANAIEAGDYPRPRELPFADEMQRLAAACQCEKKSSFSGESEEVTRLEGWQKTTERFVCLLYIAFIQTVIARLHGLMISVGGVFSLIAVAVAIYPFAPMSPFFLSGFILLPLLIWAFYHVFSQMDTDPILSRIVNGDDRKLEWNFYGKFAESLALPVLTFLSSFMPGGVGRILDVARTLLTHSQ